MIKILYLILFYLIYRITDLVLLAVMLIQMGLSIFSGEPSDSIKGFGKSLGIYLKQISEFLSYASEEKPYPFSDWPDAGTFESEPLKSESLKSEADRSDIAGSDTDGSEKNDSKPTTSSSK